MKAQENFKDLKAAAKELNNLLDLSPRIKLTSKNLKNSLLLVAQLLVESDPISKETANTLYNLLKPNIPSALTRIIEKQNDPK